jgi:predicted dithiol-disulfide oxidoreductase (DUF899 family)
MNRLLPTTGSHRQASVSPKAQTEPPRSSPGSAVPGVATFASHWVVQGRSASPRMTLSGSGAAETAPPENRRSAAESRTVQPPSERIYRTYFVDLRGDEAMGTTWSYLDITALGRQEEWEDSPEGYPQTPPYAWWNYHDAYGKTP